MEKRKHSIPGLKILMTTLLVLVLTVCLLPGKAVFADEPDTSSESQATELTVGTYTATFKCGETETFTFTSTDAGEYNIHICYADIDSTIEYYESMFVTYYYGIDDSTTIGSIYKYDELRDSCEIISMEKGETLKFTLEREDDGQLDKGANESEDIIITISPRHEGAHVLGEPELVSTYKNSYGYSSCKYVCRCKEPGCIYRVVWTVDNSDTAYINGTISPGYGFSFSWSGGTYSDEDVIADYLNEYGYIQMEEGEEFTIENTKPASKLGSWGEASIHVVPSVLQEFLGTDFVFPYKIIWNINLSSSTFTYNGKVQKPSVSVKHMTSGTLKENKNYTVTYDSGCKSVGTYQISIEGKGDYSGHYWTTSFKINPKGTTISSLKAASKAFTVKWKSQTTQTTGYQIRYSTSSSMSNAKTVTITSNKTTSKKISSLKSGKKYYVQIRTYKTKSGTKYYSSWSAKKSIKTK